MNEQDYYAAQMAMGFAANVGNTAMNANLDKKNREFASEEAQKNRDFQLEMYNRQLSDNIDWRTHAEQYNSPEAQMKRYADAGINPMYYVTGSAGNNVVTPSGIGGGSYGSTVSTPTHARVDIKDIRLAELANTMKVGNAHAEMLQAQANLYNSEANLRNMEQPIYQFNRDVYQHLINHYVEDAPDGYMESVAYFVARNMFDKIKYERDYNNWSWEDAKDYFMHQPEIRAFARDLNEHQRNQFHYELSNAKNAAQILEVERKWAKANQWKDVISKGVGAALGLFGAFKGTTIMPFTSTSSSTSESTSDVWHHKSYGK